MAAPPDDILKLREDLRSMLHQIEKELYHAYLPKPLFVKTRDEFAGRYPEADHTFLNHYARLYAERQIIAIRRMVDKDHRAISLWRVIDRLKRNPAIGNRCDLLAEHRRNHPHDSYLNIEWNDFYHEHFGPEPTPSITARTPLLRTQKRSPAIPRRYASPLVAP